MENLLIKENYQPNGNVVDKITIIYDRVNGGIVCEVPSIYEWVDLGLPSGTLWAVWNVGANRPEEYGDYFEFEKWDSSLQVPTKEEFKELKKECKWEWASVNGKQGHVVTGPNGKSIFLPAAGFREGSSLYGAGVSGFYWSSTLRENDDYRAYDLTFNSSDYKVDWYCRLYGQGLRCVKRKRQ